MKRRDFVIASAAIAGGLVPGLARAAKPCPPPQTSVSGGTSVTTSCAITSGATYSTNFDLTELPISEGNRWANNGSLWTKVRTAGGLAYGTNGANDTYDDSYAYLSGFGPNQEAQAVVYVSPALSGNAHEVELLLRWADSATTARGYECLFNFQGGMQIVRWNGAFGDFTVLPATGQDLGRNLVSGDIIKANIVGNVITAYVNGVQRLQATDTRWTSGQPGMGFFKRTTGLNSDLALTSFSATTL